MAVSTATPGDAWAAFRANHDYVALVGMALFYGVGDTVTTLLIMATPSLAEQNPVVVWLGPVGFVVAKTLLTVAGYYLATGVRSMRTAVDYRWVTTLYCGSLAVRGVHITWHNAALLL